LIDVLNRPHCLTRIFQKVVLAKRIDLDISPLKGTKFTTWCNEISKSGLAEEADILIYLQAIEGLIFHPKPAASREDQLWRPER
jgi:hypothetical protein